MRSKLFRIGFGVSLAVFMSVVAFWGSMATLPVVFMAKAETQQSGLGLDPENDPVVFTTTSGLEIKRHDAVLSGSGQVMGTSTSTTNYNNTSFTQDLTGFYYFTMGTYSGTIHTGETSTSTYTVTNEPVNWIILGRSSNPGEGVEILDTSSPAGTAVANDKNVALKNFYAGPYSVTANDEIPGGCVLVLSERLLGQVAFNGKSTNVVWYSNNYIGYNRMLLKVDGSNVGNRYRYIADGPITTTLTSTWTIANNAGGSAFNAVNRLFSKNNSTGAIVNNALNFTKAQADLVVPQQLNTYYYGTVGGEHMMETPATDGNCFYSMFLLASKKYLGTGDHPAYFSSQSYYISDYLTTNAQRVAMHIGDRKLVDEWWMRNAQLGDNNGGTCTIRCDGTLGEHSQTIVCGIRPAFVMKFTPEFVE